MALPSPHPGAPNEQPENFPTSLKWGRDGELSAVDLQQILARLSNAGLTECQLESGQPNEHRPS